MTSLASLRWLEGAVGCNVDPLRFRANLVVDSEAPFGEWDASGWVFQVGTAKVVITRPIRRCATIDTDTQPYFGVYARVVEAGKVATGDRFSKVGESRETYHASMKSDRYGGVPPDYRFAIAR